METITFELAKRLYDKGFRTACSAQWIEHYGNITIGRGFPPDKGIPAPTFTEIWRVLPSHINKFDLFTRKGDNGLCIVFYAWMGNLNDVLFVEAHESAAEAVGLLAEWLIDNGYLNAEATNGD